MRLALNHSPQQSANRNPADKLPRELNGMRIFEGRVKDVERRTEGGFARGKCSIEAWAKIRASELRLIKNEFLLAETSVVPEAMTPDLICLLDLETATYHHRADAHGFRIIVFGLPCNPQWRSKHGLELVGPGYFGYDKEYRPIEELALLIGHWQHSTPKRVDI